MNNIIIRNTKRQGAKICLLMALTLAGPNITQSQTQRYVNNVTGSDVPGAGTSTANPFKTISYAATTTTPINDTVIINVMQGTGTYFETKDIRITKSRRRICNYNGADVTIDGTNLTPVPNSFKYMIFILASPTTVNNVSIEGLKFQNCIGHGSRAIMMEGGGNNISVKNCTIKNISWANVSLSAITPSDVTNAMLFRGTMATPISNLEIKGNTVSNCATGYGEAITVSGNVTGFKIDSNTVYEIANIGIDAARDRDTFAPPGMRQARNGVISRNTVYKCASPIKVNGGIYLDGAVNVTVERNRIFDCFIGISVGAEEAMPATSLPVSGNIIRNNVIYKNSLAAAFIGTDVSTNPFVNNHFYANTLYNNLNGLPVNNVTQIDNKSIAVMADDAPGEICFFKNDSTTIQNNIIQPLANRFAFVGMWNSSTTKLISNYNLFYKPNTSPLFVFTNHSLNNLTLSNPINSIQEFNLLTGLEANSNFRIPGFTSPSAYLLTLSQCSFAIDKGNPNNNDPYTGIVDFNGFPRRFNNIRIDCGAYEYQAANLPCAFTLLNATPQCNNTTSQVKLNWTASGNALSYDVYGNQGNLLLGNTVDTLFTDAAVSAGGNYQYRIAAKNLSGSTDNTNGLVSATALNCAAPGAFTLAVTPECDSTKSKNRLAWTASSNSTGYQVYRNGTAVSSILTTLQFIDSTAVSYGTTYTYSVKAIGISTTTTNSNGDVTITSLNCSLPSTFVVNAQPECNGTKSQVKLSWNTPLYATAYQVYRVGQAASALMTTTQYTDTTNITGGTSYTYTVKAFSAGGSAFNANGPQTTTALNCIVTSVNNISNPYSLRLLTKNPLGNYIIAGKNVPLKPFFIEVLAATGQRILSKTIRPAGNDINVPVNILQAAAGAYTIKLIIDKQPYLWHIAKP